MPSLIESRILLIGGLAFRFRCPVFWPIDGPLTCYHAFLEESRGNDADPIDVSFCRGVLKLQTKPKNIFDSGDGTRWSRVSDHLLVEKILPHVSPAPLWTIKINMPAATAEIWFSEKYLEIEDKYGEWPVAAPRYPIDQHLAVHFLARRSGMLVHSAGIDHQGKGFMCSGVSGAGKTTISRMLDSADGFDLLTDDRVILRVSEGRGIMMHGTPWSGEGQYATAGTAPLKAIFFLKKSHEAQDVRLSSSETVERFMPVTSVPWFNTELMTDTMSTIEAVAQSTPAFDLYFTKSTDTIDLITDIMSRL